MSDPLTLTEPLLLFPLRLEMRGFCRQFRRTQRFPDSPLPTWFAGPEWLPVVVARNGMGGDGVRRLGEWLAGAPQFGELPYRPRLVLLAGFGGGLTDELKSGDLLLATEVVDADSGERFETTWPGPLPSGPWNPPLQRGRIVTAARPVCTIEEKQQLAREHRADAVDMESAPLARQCLRLGLPFGVLRVVLDDVKTPLPAVVQETTGDGVGAMLSLLGRIVLAPGQIPALMRLRKGALVGTERLGAALGELLTLTLPWLEQGQRGDQ